MITLQELTHYLEELLQPAEFVDYCPNGLQVEGKGKIKKIACAVSANLETIKSAVEADVDALIVHHGLFWKGDPFPVVGTKYRRLKLLLDARISLIGYHLPLDAHQGVGNNWVAAKELGWQNLESFEVGVKGTFPSVDRQVFQKQLEEYYGHQAHISLGGKENVSSAALVSGGSYRSIPQAAASGVDCFITGNFDEPAYYQAQEEGINFFALGHHATEVVGPLALAKNINSTFSIEADFIDIPNPF